jgi:hypothetical protein
VRGLAEALTPPLLIAAAVLLAAGALKLRAPRTAARAMGELGLPAGRVATGALASTEVAVGGWCVIAPTRPATIALAVMYCAFAAAAVVLARRRASCGCFGDTETPASASQSLISAAFAAIAVAATIHPAHGMPWILGRPLLDAATLTIGILGAVYATVLAYTELPRAWASWSVR